MFKKNCQKISLKINYFEEIISDNYLINKPYYSVVFYFNLSFEKKKANIFEMSYS